MSYDNLLIYVVFKTGLYIITDILCGIQPNIYIRITNHRKFKYLLCLRFENDIAIHYALSFTIYVLSHPQKGGNRI